MKAVAAMLASMLAVAPASAQEWSAYFNMATFGAGGGSDAGGGLNFECGDKDSGAHNPGRPYMTLRLAEGTELNKKSALEDIVFWVGDGMSFTLPLVLERGSADTLAYVYSPETVPEVLEFISALREGQTFTALQGERRLASVDLEGSAAALQYVEGCIADG
jgi:hypothetical protein